MKITVVGTGYVGLTAGVCLAELGNEVLCIDIDEAKIQMLKEGKVPIYEPGLDELLEQNIKDRRIQFSTDIKAGIQHGKAIFIAVGTPAGKDDEADLSAVKAVAAEIAEHATEYKVIINKSTVPVGTGAVIEGIIESKQAEFDVVSNPEFLREGTAIRDFMSPDRIVIGANSEKAQAVMKTIYKGIIRVDKPLMCTDQRSAEIIKYASNAMLATRISFMNELAALCEKTGADIKEVAKGMGLDSRIGPRFLQAGAGYGGSCLLGDELVIIKQYDEIRVIRIAELPEISTIDLEIASFDMAGEKILFKKITKVTKRQYEGNIIKVRTRMNKTVQTTDDHPFIVHDGSKWITKLARELNIHDSVPSMRKISASNRKLVINTIDILDRNVFDFKKVRVRPRNTSFSNHREIIYSKFKSTRARDIVRSNCMSLQEYLTNEIENIVDQKDLLLFTAKGKPSYVPSCIEIDNNFMRLLGFIVSEGNIHYEKNQRGIRARTNIHFNVKEKAYIEDVKKIYEQFGISYSVTHQPRNSTTTISVSSRILAFVLDTYLKCGRDSYEANIPDLVFSADEGSKTDFLRSLFRGDGHVAFPKETNSVIYEFGSISSMLVNKAILLLSTIGIVPSYKNSISKKSPATAHFFRISTKRQIKKLRSFKDEVTQKRIDRVLSNCKDIKSAGFTELNEAVCLVDITSLETEMRKTMVYSVEVEDTQNFVTSHGLIVHNCFPKDVKALAKTMRQHDLKSRIIDAVEEVNNEQKLSLVPKVQKLIPDLKDKTVAIWGLAFKPKTDDMREAPAITVINQLQELGAAIKAFDPEAEGTAKKILKNITYTASPYEAAEKADALIIVTEWNEFRSLDKRKLKEIMAHPNIIDGRNIYDPKEMTQLGFSYIGIGR